MAAKTEKLLLALVLILFLVLSCWYLDLPGLNFDECLGAAPAVKFLYGSNADPMQIDPSIIYVFGRPLPIMIMPYISGLKTLFHIPFYAILGVSAVSTRIMPVILVVISVCFFHQTVKKIKDASTATLSSLLFAVHPVTVFYMTRDITPVAIAILCLSIIFYNLYNWKEARANSFWNAWKDDRDASATRLYNKHLVIIAFMSGLGVSHKADFIWILAALFFSFLVIYSIKPSLREILFFAAGFLIGALPMVVFNFATGFMTLRMAGENFSLWDMPISLLKRITQFGNLFSGGFVSSYFTGNFSMISITASVVSIYLLFYADFNDKLTKTIVATTGIFVILSSFTQFSIQTHHLLVLTPFLCVFLANARLKSAVLLLAAILMLTSIDINYDLKKTEGVGVWSSAINDLNNDLLEYNRPVNIYEHAFTESLIVLSKGELSMRRIYAGEKPDSSGLKLYRKFENQDKIIEVYRDSRDEVFAILTY